MDDLLKFAPAVAAVSAAMAVVVSSAVFVWQRIGDSRKARAQAKADLVARVIDSVERAARAHALYPISALWRSPELELALLLPRLTSALGARDAPVAIWVARQSQRIQSTADLGEINKMAITVAYRFGEWGQGRITKKWFAERNREDPLESDFEPPQTIRRTKNRRVVGALVVLIVSILTLPELTKRVLS